MSISGAESQISSVVGGLIWGVIALLGARKAQAISKRPTTNKKCALGLMSFLIGYGLASLAGGLKLFGGTGWLVTLGWVGLYLMGFVAVVVAVVLAILGLVEIRNQPGVFVQGKAQGIWTLVLTGIFMLLVCGGFIAAIMSKEGGENPSSKPGQVTVRDDLNFKFTAPARPWVNMNAAIFNADAALAFMRRNPEISFVVIAEQFGGDNDITVNQIAEVGRGQLKSATKTCVERESTNVVINGLSGLMVQTDVTLYNRKLSYCHWYCVTNGYAYQLVAWGDSARRQLLADQFREITKGFQLADKNRIAPASGAGFEQDYISVGFPYKVALTNSAWRKWATLAKDYPEAEFGASRENCCLAVVPVRLDGETLEMEALAAGLLSTLNIDYPSDELVNRTPLTLNGMEGIQFDSKRCIQENNFLYRLRIYRGNGVGYLIAAWGLEGKDGLDKVLDDGLSRVEAKSFAEMPGAVSNRTGRAALAGEDLETRAGVMNIAGLYYYKADDYGKALALFLNAAESDKSAVIYLKNALEAWGKLNKPREALDYLEARLPGYTNKLELLYWQAYLQGENGQAALSATNFAKVFAAGYDDEDDFCSYIRILLRDGQFDEAEKQTEAYVVRHDSTTIRLLQAEVYRTRQDYPKAVALLKQQHEKSPHKMQITTELVEANLDAGFYNDALAICSGLIAKGSDSAYLWHLKGRSECGLKWYREAKASFEACLKRAPANSDAKDYLNHVSAFLGEGQNSDIKDRIEPVGLPAGIAMMTNAVPRGVAADSGACYLRRIQAVAFDSNKACRTTDYQTIRVLDASGVAAFSTFQCTFDPLSEVVYVNEVLVKDAAGKTVSTGRVSDCYVLDSPADTVSQRRVLNIPIPGLQVGNDVHVTITRRDTGKCDAFPFMEHVLACTYPVQEAVLYVHAPSNSYRVRMSGEVASQDCGEGRCWRRVEPPVSRYEPLQPAYSSFLPTLWIGDMSSTWPGIVSNYMASVSDRLVADKTVDELGRSLVAGVGGEEARISAIARYVQTNYTYKAIEFGRRARVPNKPGDIIHNKYGDCKDHSLLVWHLLRAAGIPAHLALVNVNTVVQRDLPSLDQFDHMVVYVPSRGGGQIVDATDKGDKLPDPAPFMLLGRDVLVLDERAPYFSKVARTPAYPATVQATRNVKVLPNGDVAVEETFVFGGSYGARWRSGLLDIDPSSRRLIFKQRMELQATEVDDIQIADLDDPTKPLTIRCRYTTKNQFQMVGGRLVGSLRATIDRSSLSVPLVESRLTPFELRSPITYDAAITVTAPAGFVVAQPAPGNSAPALKFLSWTCATSQEKPDRMKILVSARQKSGEFQSSDYAAYRSEMNQLLTAVEAPMVFEPAGK